MTVKENVEDISNRQLKKAQDVKRLQNALGMPSHADLKAIITMNMIQDKHITHNDINLAERVFRNPIGEMKRKTSRQNKKFQQQDIIEIPEELIQKNKNLVQSIDTMYVNDILFLTCISHNLYYRTAQYLPPKQKGNYIKIYVGNFNNK